MSNPRFGAVPAGHIGAGAIFVNTDGTACKILLEPQGAAAATATSPQFYGGASVYDLIAHSTDSASKDLQLYRGDVLTTVGGATGTLTTTATTIVRASGSFIAEGWRVGRQAGIFAATTDAPQAVEGVAVTVTGVTAATLTVTGTALSALTVAANSRIVSLQPLYSATAPAGSGNSAAVGEAWILSSASAGAARTKDEKLGATQVLVVAPKTAVTASTALAVTATAARY